jgi:hypothetical protein
VLYKGMLACVHMTNHKAPYRVFIEWRIDHSPTELQIRRDWVVRSSLTPLEPAVSNILNAVNNNKEK